MIPCINQATVLPTDTLEFFEQSKEAGFSQVELDITKLEEALKKYDLRRIDEVRRRLGIKIVSLNSIENLPILTKGDFAASLSRCESIFRLSNELDCDIVVLNPNEFKPGGRARIQKAFDSFVAEAAVTASKFHVGLGYEFVSYDNRVVNTLEASIRKLEKWDSGIGLVLDIFHLFRSGEKTTFIPDRLFNRVWIFHVNDAPSWPISRLKDSDRVFPGEGVIDARQAVQELAARGFSGPVSLELFNSSYWKRPAGNVLRESWSRMHDLLAGHED